MDDKICEDDVQSLLRSVREFILHPRRLDPLVKDTPNWNMAASAMDVISDTEWAITTYERGEFADTGLLYLVLYGLLQAIYVQQDGLESLVRALEKNHSYKIYNESEASCIRQVRHDTIGHPTMQGGLTPHKDGRSREQISHTIVQHSLRKEGFTLSRYSNLTASKLVDYETAALISKNRAMTVRILKQTKKHLEEIEMQHRRRFRGETLTDLFPNQIAYYFEKVYEAINKPSHGNDNIGELGLRTVLKAFKDFKQALVDRKILNDLSPLRYELDETEYPLSELELYLKRQGSLTDKRAASIFAHFAQQKMAELRRIAAEIDAEYEADLPTHS